MPPSPTRSVQIFAPPARAEVAIPAPGLADEKLLLLEENRQLRSELDKAHVATRTMASVAVALARMLHDDKATPVDREIVIPRDLYEKLAGCEVAISEDADRNVVARIKDNLTHPVWAGR